MIGMIVKISLLVLVAGVVSSLVLAEEAHPYSAVAHKTNMPKDMQEGAFRVARNSVHEGSAYLPKTFDEVYGKTWICEVNKEDINTTPEMKYYIHFTLNYEGKNRNFTLYQVDM